MTFKLTQKSHLVKQGLPSRWLRGPAGECVRTGASRCEAVLQHRDSPFPLASCQPPTEQLRRRPRFRFRDPELCSPHSPGHASAACLGSSSTSGPREQLLSLSHSGTVTRSLAHPLPKPQHRCVNATRTHWAPVLHFISLKPRTDQTLLYMFLNPCRRMCFYLF